MANENEGGNEGAGGDAGGEVDAVAEAAIVARAKSGGWVEKDAYTKEESTWVDAKTFVDRGKRFTSNLIKEVETLRRTVDSFNGTREAFKKYSEERVAEKDAQLTSTISELKTLRNQAIREGSDEDVNSYEDRITSLTQQKAALQADVQAAAKAAPAATPTAPDLSNPILEEWVADGNEWFQTDAKLRDYAVALSKELRDGGEKRVNRAFLDHVRSLMEVEFPRKFGKIAPRNNVEGGGASGARGAHGKTAADLPEADRKLMEQFDKEGWVKKADFLKGYFERNKG